MNYRKILIAATLLIWSYGASAQWQWIDETGRKVFSDRPPPGHIPVKNILKQPHGAASANNPDQVIYQSENPEEPAANPTAVAKPKEAAEPEKPQDNADEVQRKAAEEAQRKAQEAEAQKEAAKLAELRKDNCQRARTVLTTLNSGRLLSNINEKGERGIMTEQQRQAELQRTQKAIKDNC